MYVGWPLSVKKLNRLKACQWPCALYNSRPLKQMRNLQTHPIYRAEELGLPIPDSPHACSVALPLWEHVIGYEEQEPAVIDRLQTGYPRFFINHAVRRLNAAAAERFAKPGEAVLVFPSEPTALRCAKFLWDMKQLEGRIEDYGSHGLYAVLFPEEAMETPLEYWRNCGELVSTRHAEAALSGIERPDGEEAKKIIRARLAEQAGQPIDHVYLFPSGMSAVFSAHRMLRHLFPDRKTAQLEFPYVDVLQIQRNFGPGVHFFPCVSDAELDELESIMNREALAGILCEVPSNPLMRCVDVQRIAALAREHNTPLLIDDTIASSMNIDALAVADLITTSLTKWFSGTGDVMCGSLILRGDSPFYDRFKAFLDAEYCDEFWGGDAVVLEENSRNYPERMRTINENGQRLFEFFQSRPEIESLYFVGDESNPHYKSLMREDGGYGALMSFELKNSAVNAPRFYDALEVSKGPSLGTDFSLVCPYVLLAHYFELDWAESCDVPRNLIRVSIGLEDPDDLIARFTRAFESI